jgi:glutaredoxin
LASIGLKSYIIPFKNNEHDEWIVYTLPDCKYCTFAKQYLTNMKIPFSEIKYTVETCDELKKTLESDTIPSKKDGW